MEQNFTLLSGLSKDDLGVDSKLSFRKFIELVGERAEREKVGRKDLSHFILDHVEKNPHWLNTPDINNLQAYDGILELIYTLLVSPFADEEQTYWGLGLPFVPSIFFGTKGLYQFIESKQNGQLSAISRIESDDELRLRKLKALYAFVLHRLYDFPTFAKFDFIHPVDEGKDGIRYMKVELDLTFVDVYAKQPLPRINVDLIRYQHIDNLSMDYLLEKLPLSLFSFEGFSVLSARDYTFDYVMSANRNAIVVHQGTDRLQTISHVLDLFKSLIADKQVEFGLLPLPELNGKLAVPYSEQNPLSLLTRYGLDAKIKERAFLEVIETFRRNPKLRVIKRDDANGDLLHTLLGHSPFKALTLVPVFHNKDMVGILEAYTYHDKGLGEQCLGRVTLALPLLSQLVKKTLEEFDFTIRQVVNEGFTTIQPAVEWKFKEAAWKHLKRYGLDYTKRELTRVSFEQLYPLYGAIDIRNSTVERNRALKADLLLQMKALHELVSTLCEETKDESWKRINRECEGWLTRLEGPFSSTLEHNMMRFLAHDIHPQLERLRQVYPEQAERIALYDSSLDASGRGLQYHRQQLEDSIQMINRALAAHLAGLKQQLNERYPNYFETFRTDGLEYDVYVGQSIAPEQPFDDTIVGDFRIMQLESMADVVRLTEALTDYMPVALQTTQLIFVHENPIDISFRNDEKRFGVEGAYNIRYEILKKRIDKVRINHTDERLTQPGKIAVVYFDEQLAREYVDYISRLQQQGKLNNDLEYLELEELQGVNGLKALRVGVPSAKSQSPTEIQSEVILQNLL